MVEIYFHAVGKRHARIIAIIIILLQHDHVRFRERVDNSPRNRGLAGSGSAADANDQRPAIRRRWSSMRNGLLLARIAASGASPEPRGATSECRPIQRFSFADFFPSITACAAASRAIATRNGEALT